MAKVSPAPIQSPMLAPNNIPVQVWKLWYQSMFTAVKSHEETLQYFFYDESIDRLHALKAIQTTETSLWYGYTLKASVVGQEIGAHDLISGNSVLFPFIRYDNTDGTDVSVKLSAIEDISGKADDGFVVFQPVESDTLTITKENPLIANFTNITTAFVSAQRVRGFSGKMTWKIESPTAANPSEYVTVFDGMDYDFFVDFDNPTGPAADEYEIYYPFDIGYRAGQVLRLTFSSYDGNDVQVKGDDSSGLPYFSTRFQEQVFENMYSVEKYPRGVMCMDSNSTTTTISTKDVPVKIAGTLLATDNNRHFTVASSIMTYTGEFKQVFDISLSLDVKKLSGSGVVDTYKIEIYVNGSSVGCGNSISTYRNNEYHSATANADAELETGDTIEAYITNTTGTANVIVEEMYIKAR